MPFKHLSDLPGAITDNLPQHGQEIYMAAYNDAWNQYTGPDDRCIGATRAETAHRVAWEAVKKAYTKNIKTGKWESKAVNV